MKILIVDDSKAMRLILLRTLRQAGYTNHTFAEAASGVEALTALKSNPADLILSDWNMPEMSGLELLKTLRAHDPGVRLGFVTSESSEEMRSAASEAGALFFLCKPFTPEGLKVALGPVIR